MTLAIGVATCKALLPITAAEASLRWWTIGATATQPEVQSRIVGDSGLTCLESHTISDIGIACVSKFRDST